MCKAPHVFLAAGTNTSTSTASSRMITADSDTITFT